MSFAVLNAPINLADVGSLDDAVRSFPVGTYPVLFESASVEATKSNANSGKVVLVGRVLDGEHAGNSFVFNLNLYSENEKARQIAAKELYKIACCAGHPLGQPVSNLSVLGSRPVMLTFAAQIDRETGLPHAKGFTELKGVTDVNGGKPYLPSQSAHAPAPAAAAPAQAAPAQPALAQAAPAAAGGWGGAPAAAQPAGGWGGAAPAQPAQAAAPAGWGAAPAGGAPKGWGG